MRTRAVLLVAAGLFVIWPGQVSAYKPARARLIPLTEATIRKVVDCYRSVGRAEARASGTRSEVYRNRSRLRDAALTRCGFPTNAIWRDAAYSARIALGDLDEEVPLDEPRSANRKLAAPFRTQLARIFAE
jgi:hypothetical protein